MGDRQFDNPDNQAARIFVGNVHNTVEEGDLRNVFSKHGNIRGVIILKGFAFVQYENEADASKAIELENGTEIHGKNIQVKIAKKSEKQQRKDPPPPPPQENMESNDNWGNDQQWNSEPSAGNDDYYEESQGGGGGDGYYNQPKRGRGNNNWRGNSGSGDRGGRGYRGGGDRGYSGGDRGYRGGDRGYRGGDRGGGRGRGGRGRGGYNNYDNYDEYSNRQGDYNYGGGGNNFRGRGGRGRGRGGGGSDNFFGGSIPPAPTGPVDMGKRNDVEIVCANRQCTRFAENIEIRCRTMGLDVDVLFPNPDIPLQKILGNIASRGVMYAILITPMNIEHSSVTVNVLQGTQQEHRNMPIDDALDFISRNYEKDLKSLAGKEPPLGDGHPKDILNVLEFFHDNRPLSVMEYDKLIKYLARRREEMLKTEYGNSIPAHLVTPPIGPPVDPAVKAKQEELQTKISTILKKKDVKGAPPAINPSLQKAIDSLIKTGPNLLNQISGNSGNGSNLGGSSNNSVLNNYYSSLVGGGGSGGGLQPPPLPPPQQNYNFNNY